MINNTAKQTPINQFLPDLFIPFFKIGFNTYQNIRERFERLKLAIRADYVNQFGHLGLRARTTAYTTGFRAELDNSVLLIISAEQRPSEVST